MHIGLHSAWNLNIAADTSTSSVPSHRLRGSIFSREGSPGRHQIRSCVMGRYCWIRHTAAAYPQWLHILIAEEQYRALCDCCMEAQYFIPGLLRSIGQKGQASVFGRESHEKPEFLDKAQVTVDEQTAGGVIENGEETNLILYGLLALQNTYNRCCSEGAIRQIFISFRFEISRFDLEYFGLE
jgi:hypothetical protein